MDLLFSLFFSFVSQNFNIEMNETNLSLSTNQKLQPFLLLSKSAKGVANNKLISDALSAPSVYVFTELYESPNVVEVSVTFKPSKATLTQVT